MRFDCVLPTVTVSPIWNCHFHNPGSTWVRLNSTPLRFIFGPSDSPAIRLFSGEEKVCSKQDSFPGCPGGVLVFFWKQGRDATSPPDRRDRIAFKPTQARSIQDWSFQDWFFEKMVRRAIVGGYLTISAHAAFVPYSTMY
jgi:hypothetical protein